MRRTLRAEMLKLTTVRLPVGLLGVAAALTAAITALRASQAGGSGHLAGPPLDTGAGLTAVLASTDVALLLAAVLGAVVAGGEAHHRTATATYLAVPDRRAVVAAKAGCAAVAGALFGLVAAAVATAVALGFVAADGTEAAVGAGTMARYAAGATLGGAVLGAAGVGAGALVRNQLDAVMIILVWGMLAEQVVGGLFDAVAPFLPYTAATTLAGTPLGGEAGPLPFAVAAALVAAAGILLLAAGATAVSRRDVG